MKTMGLWKYSCYVKLLFCNMRVKNPKEIWRAGTNKFPLYKRAMLPLSSLLWGSTVLVMWVLNMSAPSLAGVGVLWLRVHGDLHRGDGPEDHGHGPDPTQGLLHEGPLEHSGCHRRRLCLIRLRLHRVSFPKLALSFTSSFYICPPCAKSFWTLFTIITFLHK